VCKIYAGEKYPEEQSSIGLRGNSKIEEVELSIIGLTAFAVRPKIEIGSFKGVGQNPTIGLDNVDLTIGNIIADPDTKLHVSIRFSKLEHVSYFEMLGEVNVPIFVTVDGQKVFLVTDAEGNELERWTEQADPFDIESPFMKINDTIDFNSITIKFVEWLNNGGYYSDKTLIYMLDSNGYVCRAPITKTEDGFMIKDGNTLIAYSGNAKSPIIPDGITHISKQAFIGCLSIESITIPEGVISVDEGAFEQCLSMTSLSLPKSLEFIHKTSLRFGNDSATRTISFAGSRAQWMRVIHNESSGTDVPCANISCSDGTVDSFEATDAFYLETYVSDRTYCAEYDGNTCDLVFIFRRNPDNCAMYYYYFTPNGIESFALFSEKMYSYSAEKNIYSVTVTINESFVYHIKPTDTGFVFCDENGTEIAEQPNVNIY
jgi:hypothetical protein